MPIASKLMGNLGGSHRAGCSPVKDKGPGSGLLDGAHFNAHPFASNSLLHRPTA